ncbi:hypothetical protein GGS23DRAFT_601715 [Durotheca rogersii]|uniref:uncharacterized protein n=1 Tax=Durotheca rogersii TaxID=419775 RepID=UPI00221EA7A3|nr:uncharacterized protein GGS23DRAFT_601715 [Durotheca rogersii]KAI5853659.1 hypothetical protein GGS23DRAFT_601715 [Durotheca rogersii]
MEELWQAAETRFHDKTGYNLTSKPFKSFEDCIKQIETPEDATTSEIEETGIVVFPPASLCFNALSFLLDIPEKLHNFRQAVASLLGELEPSLNILKIYGTINDFQSLGPELIGSIHKIMIGFVDICALSIQLRNGGKWDRFKVRWKVALSSESTGDIQQAIDNFKTLVGNHNSIQNTQTLKKVTQTLEEVLKNDTKTTKLLYMAAETGKQVDYIAKTVGGAESQRKIKEDHQKFIANIKSLLRITDSMVESHENTRDQSFARAVKWFYDEGKCPKFHQWARAGDGAQPLLVLSGGQNTGKSVVSLAITEYLRRKPLQVTNLSRQNCVAACFFPARIGEDDGMEPVENALKCIVLQLANQDVLFARHLSKICVDASSKEVDIQDKKGQQLWEFLEIETFERKSIHYIVIDGLESLKTNDQRKLLTILDSIGATQKTLKVLLSMRLDSRIGVSLEARAPHIDIAEENNEDLRNFIEHEMEQRFIYQDDDDQTISIRRTFINKLIDHSNGDYVKVGRAIDRLDADVDKIGSVEASDKMFDKIFDINYNEITIATNALASLERRLNGNDLEELQELLLWTHFGLERLNVDQLYGIMFMQFGTHSKNRLLQKITGTYSDVFKIVKTDRGEAVEIVEGLKALFQDESSRQTTSADDTPRISATITITKADLSSVQSFYWDFMQKLNHAATNFDQLAQRSNVGRSVTKINKLDGYLRILRLTFRILDQPPCKKTEQLSRYLLRYLPSHLKALGQPSGLLPHESNEIGKNLYTLFESGHMTKLHWVNFSEVTWHRHQSELELLVNWLTDATVIGTLGLKDQRWLQDVRKSPNPSQSVLFEIVKMLANQWLQDAEWDVAKPFEWLYGYMLMGDNPSRASESQDAEEDETDGYDIIDDAIIARVASYCKSELQIPVKNQSVWHQRLGETFRVHGFLDKADAAFTEALLHDDSNPDIYMSSAEACAKRGELNTACDRMRHGLELLKKKPSPDNSRISAAQERLGDWLHELEDWDAAIKNERDVLDANPSSAKAYSRLLRSYLVNDLDEDAAKLIRELLEDEKDSKNPSIFWKVIGYLYDLTEDFSHTIKLLALMHRNSHVIGQDLPSLVESVGLEAREPRSLQPTLHLVKGIANYFHGGNLKLAVDSWQECMNIAHAENRISERDDAMATHLLSAHYFRILRTKDPVEGREHVERLERIAARSSSTMLSPAKAYLASYYVSREQPSKVREIVEVPILLAFEVLFDDEEYNDGWGFDLLRDTLIHCGNDADSLTSFYADVLPRDGDDVLSWVLLSDESDALTRELSEQLIDATVGKTQEKVDVQGQVGRLLSEVERQLAYATSESRKAESGAAAQEPGHAPQEIEGHEIPETIKAYRKIGECLEELSDRLDRTASTFCDECGQHWGFAIALNVCKTCHATAFCDTCLTKVHQGPDSVSSVPALACDKDHPRLRLPKWTKEDYLRSLRDEVMAGGKIQYDQRIGGWKLAKLQWAEEVKREWDSYREPPAGLSEDG